MADSVPISMPEPVRTEETTENVSAVPNLTTGQVTLVLLVAVIVAGIIYWAVKKFIPYKK